MDIALSQDPRQAVDWLAQGKFAFLLLTSPRELMTAKEKGLPVNILDPRNSKSLQFLKLPHQTCLLMDRRPSQCGESLCQLAVLAGGSDFFSKESGCLRFG